MLRLVGKRGPSAACPGAKPGVSWGSPISNQEEFRECTCCLFIYLNMASIAQPLLYLFIYFHFLRFEMRDREMRTVGCLLIARGLGSMTKPTNQTVPNSSGPVYNCLPRQDSFFSASSASRRSIYKPHTPWALEPSNGPEQNHGPIEDLCLFRPAGRVRCAHQSPSECTVWAV